MEFSKKTGDYASLSLTDMKVLALTYQIEKEKVGIDHIRTAPVVNKTISYEYGRQDDFCDLPGWYSEGGKGGWDDCEEESQDDEESRDSDEDSENNNEDSGNNDEESKKGDEIQPLTENFETLSCGGEQTLETENQNELEALKKKFEKVEYEIDEETNKKVEEILEKVEDDCVTDDWITPSSRKQNKQKKIVEEKKEDDEEFKVACITTDFAIQNVLKQMNLNVAALDGRVIKQLRTFILRCYVCSKTTSIMTKKFCKHCGYQTLKKVAVSVDEEGKMVIHINGRKTITGKGKRYSLPTMKGGKHPNNPILCEDQRIPHNRLTKTALKKNNPLDDDYIAGE